ncbi:MAG TPA: cytochrome b/b6 domain-containing protein [Burkholderiales bacterium]|nr:cytochrome b/b6 domain-containing protein [Burkholderiales bacterium]
MSEPVLVWDVPTRVFHWLLALSFAGAFLTADTERLRDVHVLLGYSMVGLIGFRIVWGLLGTRYARFRSFLFSPRELLQYVRSLLTRSPRHYLGHNPAGSLVIFMLLALGIVTGASGLAVYNDVGGEWLEELHEGAAFAMLALVFVHIAGVLVASLLHRENLVRAMITGRKRGEPGQGIRRGHAWVAALLLATVAAAWVWVPTQQPSAAAAAQERGHGDREERG